MAGAWATAVPYFAEAVGLTLDVAARVEVVDHVIPGVVVMACAAALATGRAADGVFALSAAGAAFLAGFWITTTHVPLLFDIGDAGTTWGPALLHFSAGPPVAAVALWLTLAAVDGRR